MQFVRKYYPYLKFMIIVLSVMFAVLWGFKKHGFFIDEYYTYTISNGTQLGIAIESGKWNDTSAYIEQLVSEGEENFHFKQMYENTANDVHPPLYYVLIHFVSSVFSGIFSKWIGLSVNMLLMIPTLLLVDRLAWKLSSGNELTTLITLALYGFSPLTVSFVMLIRMYFFLALWTLLYAYIHVCDLGRDKLSLKFLISVFLVGFSGFLTQYYFVVIMFFITFVYAFYLLVFCYRVKDAVIYGFTALFSLICTYFVWPSSVFHIFKGYRGKGAFEQLKDISGIWDRTLFYFRDMNRNVFSGIAFLFFLFLLLGVYILLRFLIQQRKEHKKHIMRCLSVSTRGIILLSIASVLAFFVLSRIGLASGEASCRHVYIAYALFMVILPSGLEKTFRNLIRKPEGFAHVVTAVTICLILVLGYLHHQVLFLYEDEIVATNYAKEHPDSKVVLFQTDNGMYDTRIQELMMYPQVYYVSVNDLNTAEDETIAGAKELLVYMSTQTDQQEACFESIYDQNPNIKKADHLWDSNFYFSVYLMH